MTLKEYLDNNHEQSGVTQCVLCEKPLGQETQDLEIPVCHEHRKCPKCCRPVESRPEIDYCLVRNIEIRHARCLSLDTPNLDMEIELLNIGRLVMLPNPLMTRESKRTAIGTALAPIIHNLKHDEILLILDAAQTLSAACSLALSKNRREIEQAVSEREQINEAKAKKEREEHKEKAPKTAKQKLSKDEATLAMFMQMGMTKEQALLQMQSLAEAKKDMLK
ncbi:MAG: hypothetical protein KGI50_06760 [Patescibacteria group bacterium]|nr:hypothetical protein [Patescibacteria group bacterium]